MKQMKPLKPMNWYTGVSRPQPPAGGRRGMSTGMGIFLIALGAVLVFALTGSPHWLNLRIVGVILIVAGAVGLLLPRLARGPKYPDQLRRWVSPRKLQGHGQPPLGEKQFVDEDGQTLADSVLGRENNPQL